MAKAQKDAKPATKPAADRPPRPPRDPKKWRIVNRLQLGELLGVHPDTVTDYVRSGMPVITRGGAGRESAYDAVECLTWWRKGQGKNAREEAQARALNAAAELNELKLAQQRGELWPRDQIILEGQNYTKAWSAKLRAWPRRLTQAGITKRDQEPAIMAIVGELLDDIAAWKTAADTALRPDESTS